ncbi:MAG: sulfur oxidation c-type cytochrome SoxA [Gammaproteobacteria bacterium]|nr:sulfur oxidation c-type cytochrome SoxA [Gammaproteobacteria bacterium]
MRKIWSIVAVGCLMGIAGSAMANPDDDLKAVQKFFKERFPDVKTADYVNGVYALDAGLREQWQAIEDFPPYEMDVDAGKKLFETPFKNGKTYGSCFDNGGIGIAHKYPVFDAKTNKVVTLEQAVNECRKANGEEALPWYKGKIAQVLAYMNFTARGNIIKVEVPNDAAREAYEQGRKYYFARRGQLNMSCAHCHIDNAGRRIRADLLSPAVGQGAHWPVYRSDWGAVGTLQMRFDGCNKQVRAKPAAPQSDEYRNLEYFLTYMSNGLPLAGPTSRK